MKTLFRPSPRWLALAAAILAGAPLFLGLDPAGANVSARYGVGKSPVGTYRATMPLGARRVYIEKQLYFLYSGVYYKPVMLQGRVAYLAVETTWQRQ